MSVVQVSSCTMHHYIPALGVVTDAEGHREYIWPDKEPSA